MFNRASKSSSTVFHSKLKLRDLISLSLAASWTRQTSFGSTKDVVVLPYTMSEYPSWLELTIREHWIVIDCLSRRKTKWCVRECASQNLKSLRENLHSQNIENPITNKRRFLRTFTFRSLQEILLFERVSGKQNFNWKEIGILRKKVVIPGAEFVVDFSCFKSFYSSFHEFFDLVFAVWSFFLTIARQDSVAHKFCWSWRSPTAASISWESEYILK
jgi:hypothetical protein